MPLERGGEQQRRHAIGVAFGARGHEPGDPLDGAVEQRLAAEKIAADVAPDEAGIETEAARVRIVPCRVENQDLVTRHRVHVRRPAAIGLLGIEVVDIAGLSDAGKAHHEHARFHPDSGPFPAQPRRDLAQDDEPTQVAHGHVPLDAFGGLLALRSGHDAGREENEIEAFRRQCLADALRLAHQAQIRLHELDSRHVRIAKSLSDGDDVGAAGRQQAAEGTTDAARSTDDGDIRAFEILGRSVARAPCDGLISLHDGRSLSRAMAWLLIAAFHQTLLWASNLVAHRHS